MIRVFGPNPTALALIKLEFTRNRASYPFRYHSAAVRLMHYKPRHSSGQDHHEQRRRHC